MDALIQQLKALEIEAQRLSQENVRLQAQLILLQARAEEKKQLDNAAFC